MKHLRLFQSNAEYTAYAEGDMVLPNVSYVKESSKVHFKPYVPPPPFGDIAYWNGSEVKTVSRDKWDTSLGTPVGVVVIPEGMLPDGRARMISLKYATSAGTSSDSSVNIDWSPMTNLRDTSLTNYTTVPTTRNTGGTSTTYYWNGYLPSDMFTGATSFVDSKAKYYGTSDLIPSPYSGDDKTFNPEYSKEILSGGTNVNCLSDFNGLSNTEVLVGLGTAYKAANAAHNYDGGVTGTGIQWYLPAVGELGFLMPRFNEINTAITNVGGVAVAGGDIFWSSSEESSTLAYGVDTNNGSVVSYSKYSRRLVRPFALL